MMKRLLMSLFGIVLGLTLAGAAHAETVINGIDKDYPPFAFIDEKGNVAGFDVESMDWIAKKMGFTVEHKAYEWKTIVQMVVENKIHMICSGMSITAERAAQVTFSNPYWTVRKVFVSKNGSDLNSEKILNSKVRLGVQQGTNEATLLQGLVKDGKANFTLVQYATSSDAIADLLNGRIVAVALDSAPAENAMRAGRPIMEVGTFSDVDEFGVAVNKANTELLTKINEGYKLLMADPFWEVLQKKYKLNNN